MCRLLGEVGFFKGESESDQQFQELTAWSRRGGPDHTGYFSDRGCRMGFNRLAILDTTAAGNQPMRSSSGRYTLMLNGEVYNYKELCERYALNGLQSGSDAEVIAHLVDRLPLDELLNQMNGMFGLALWDSLEQTIHLARDPVGIKPLYYGVSSHGLVFSSQFDQVVAHPWHKDFDWDVEGLRAYMQFGFMPEPVTIWKSVRQLEAGSHLSYQVATGSMSSFFFCRPFNDDKAYALDETSREAALTLKQTLQSAVARQLVADVPVGVFLSGGIDSTLVAAMAREQRDHITALTVGFGPSDLDEAEKASVLAASLGIRHEVIRFGDGEVLNILDDHFRWMGEPLADYGTLPSFLISRAAAQAHKVMLSGDGGDELFWGYPRFRTFVRSLPWFSLPNKNLRKIAGKTLRKLGCDVTGSLGAQNIGAANRQFHSYLPDSILECILPGISPNSSLEAEFVFSGTDREDALYYLRRNEFRIHLQQVLAKVDRMSMAHGLEVRVPLLDLEVVRFAERVRPQLTVRHQELKYLLRQVLSEYVPQELFDGPKKGFMPPMDQWAARELRQDILEVLQETSSLRAFPWDIRGVRKLTDSYFRGDGPYGIHNIWPLYVLLKWKTLAFHGQKLQV